MGWVVFQRGDRRTQVLGRQETQMGGGFSRGEGREGNREGGKEGPLTYLKKPYRVTYFIRLL